jgi:hypothetical protein
MASKHVVKPGESPSGIAARYGAESWSVIYQDAANAELREKRKDEHAVFPGDVVNIPKIAPKVFSLATAKRHKLVVPRPKSQLNVVVKDGAGEPLSVKAFQLSAPGLDHPIKGTTTGDGRVDCKVPADLQQAQLVVWDSDEDGIRYVWELDVGGLFGPETTQGVRQRLNNLGYHAGQADSDGENDYQDDGGESDADGDENGEADVPSDPLGLAIAAFQEDMGLDVSGKLDEQTLAKLVEEHGGT